MNAFDVNILEFFNRFAHHAHILDESVVTLDTPVLKGGVVVAFVWWAWFADEGPDASRRRRILLSTLAASIMSVAVARSIAHVLPFRVRPLYEPELHFVPPFGASDIDLESWSSFPSDHAVLFFTLATGL